MTSLRSITGAAILAGALAVGALGFPAVSAADDPDAVPQAMLDTTCSLDQIMAAAKVVDPVTYGEIIEKYNTESPFVQGEIVKHMNLLLEKSPQQRQSEVDELANIFPAYVGLFRTAEPTANELAAKCVTFPAVDPAVWNAAAPAPATEAAPAPATEAAPAPATDTAPVPPIVTGPGPVMPQPATAVTPAA